MHPHLHQVFAAGVRRLFLPPEGLIAASTPPTPTSGWRFRIFADIEVVLQI